MCEGKLKEEERNYELERGATGNKPCGVVQEI